MLRILLAIAAVAVLIIVFGSGASSPRADLVVYNGQDPSTLDPQRLSWIPDMRVARLVYEPLVQNDVLDWDSPVVPAAAESWTVSDDSVTYTFTIRADARWSNGEPVKSGDFLYAWRRGMLPDIASDYAAMFRYVRGADAFYTWRADQLAAFQRGTSAYADGAELWDATLERFDQTVGLSAPDDRTLIVELREPVPFFLDLCAFAVFAPVYPPLVAQYESPNPDTGRLTRRAGWTRPPALVSNGPFSVAEWRFKRGMRLAQNPHYWNRSSLHVRTIEIPSIGDPNAAILGFRTGAIDLMADVVAPYRGEIVQNKLEFRAEHASEVRRLEAAGLDPFAIDAALPADRRSRAHVIPAFGTYFWNFNCSARLADGRDNPFADPRVRRAFALVIDKKSIADQVRRLGEPTADTLIPPGSIGGYTSPAGLPNIGDAPTDEARRAIIDRALALLADAGYPDPGAFPITVELLFNKDSGHDLIAQVIARNWQEHLGVAVSLKQKELKVYREDLKNHAFVTSRAGWFGDYADPTTFLDIMRTGDGNNDRRFSSARYDTLLAAARSMTDPGARLDALAEAERILIEEELPMVPIFHYVSMYMFDASRITGMSAHPRTKQNLFLIDVLGDGVGAEQPRPMRGTRRRADAPTSAAAQNEGPARSREDDAAESTELMVVPRVGRDEGGDP